MVDVQIRPITEMNKSEALALRVHPEQETFIETVEECLEEAAEVPNWQPVALYAAEKMVGFAMYGSFGPQKDTWIDRILIDQNEQGKGYGKAAMLRLIDIVMEQYEVNRVYLSFVEANQSIGKFYQKLGFEDIGEKDQNGELIYRYQLPEKKEENE